MQQANPSIDSGRHTPSPELASSVRALITSLGVLGASRELSISRETTTRIAAGGTVRLASLKLVEARLAERAAAPHPSGRSIRKGARGTNR